MKSYGIAVRMKLLGFAKQPEREIKEGGWPVPTKPLPRPPPASPPPPTKDPPKK